MYTKRHFARSARKGIYVLLLITLQGLFTSNLSAQVLNEDTLKANYLIGFVDFVRWERGSKDTIVIGLVGNTTLERQIRIIADKKHTSGNKRTFLVRTINPTTDPSVLESIDVIYFPNGTQQTWPMIIPKAKELGILTVGDSSAFLDSGGLIGFVVKKNRLRFALNIEASEAYRISLSSKLARLAVEN